MKKALAMVSVMAIFTLSLGAAWTKKRLTYNAGDSQAPAVAAEGANVCVAYVDDTPGNDEIYFRRSADGGATWQSAKRLTNNTQLSASPRLAVSGANVYVVWYDEAPGNAQIYFRRSNDYGATWQAEKRLTFNPEYSYLPDIAASGANVYVAWSDSNPGNLEIYFRHSSDNGATWQTAKRLTSNSGFSAYPALAASGANVYVAWTDCSSGNCEIYFRRSADGGATWQSAKRITNNTGNSDFSRIASSGSNIYLVWVDDIPGNFDIYFRKSVDGGGTWQTAQRLTNNAGNSYEPAIASSGSNVYVAWYDETPGNLEIYFRKSTDNGATWQTAIRLTNNSVGDSYSDITVGDVNVFVAWDEWVSTDYEIFLKYSPR